MFFPLCLDFRAQLWAEHIQYGSPSSSKSRTTDDTNHFPGAFSLSSGTLGGALASSLSGVRSIALSYGIMSKNTSEAYHDPAFKLSSKIINHLTDNWSSRGDKVLYSVNVPMVERLLHEDGLKIYWTSVWRCGYGRLFTEVPQLADGNVPSGAEKSAVQLTDATVSRESGGNSQTVVGKDSLAFGWNPDLSKLIGQTSAPPGSDGWALNMDAASVTPYLACFAELPESEHGFASLEDREWKL